MRKYVFSALKDTGCFSKHYDFSRRDSVWWINHQLCGQLMQHNSFIRNSQFGNWAHRDLPIAAKLLLAHPWSLSQSSNWHPFDKCLCMTILPNPLAQSAYEFGHLRQLGSLRRRCWCSDPAERAPLPDRHDIRHERILLRRVQGSSRGTRENRQELRGSQQGDVWIFNSWL